MRNCDQNIAKLKEENKLRDAEIERKRQQLRILQAKRQRIEQQKEAVEQYESFLQDVKNQNNDDYSEVNEIRDRHLTLDTTKNTLMKKKVELTEMYEQKRADVNNYERMMENKIMKLNNNISQLTKVNEEVESEKSILQSNEEETSAKKWEQISELSQVIAAIDMIENLCSRKDQPHIHTTTLPYANNSQQQKSFDSFSQCEEIAMKQLEFIGYYMKDFKSILDGVKLNAGRARGANESIEEDSDEEL